MARRVRVERIKARAKSMVAVVVVVGSKRSNVIGLLSVNSEYE